MHENSEALIDNWSLANARSAVECGTTVPLCGDHQEKRRYRAALQSGLPAACRNCQ